MIDMELLTRQEPILFYKHLILFEDFLHDNGVAQLRSGRVLHLPPALSLTRTSPLPFGGGVRGGGGRNVVHR